MIGDKIKRLRELYGVSPKELAAKIGCQRNYLYQLERGDRVPASKKLYKLADALKTTVDFLLDESRDEISISARQECYFMKYRNLPLYAQNIIDQVVDAFVNEKEKSKEEINNEVS